LDITICLLILNAQPNKLQHDAHFIEELFTLTMSSINLMNEKVLHMKIYFSLLYSRVGYYKSYPPYKESRPRDLGRTRKEVGKIYA
jgi:hypothetical protein